MPKSPSNYFSWFVFSHSKWDKVVLQLCRALLSGRGHDHFVKLLPLGLAIKNWVKFVVMQGWGESFCFFAYSSSGVRPWAWNYFDRNNWRLRLRLCDQNPLSSLFVLHFRLLFVKKIINNWSSDLISDEFWAEAINISQRLETWLAKKIRKCLSKSDWLISRRVPTKTGIQRRRAEAALPIRICHSQIS